jgi:hypothetical protein
MDARGVVSRLITEVRRGRCDMQIGEARVLIGVGLILLASAVSYAQTTSEITVFGTNTYPNDVQAVQNAVDNYDVVTLVGTFNFGQGEYPSTPAGAVFMTHPNVTLEADEVAGATILGGGAPSDVSWIWPVIDVRAPGITVRGLTMVDSADTGVYVHGLVGPSTTPTGVTISGNTISALWAGIYVYGYRLSGSDPIKVFGNSVSSQWFAVYLHYTGGLPIEVSNNAIFGDGVGILSRWHSQYYDSTDDQIFQGMSPLDITNNEVVVGGGGFHSLVDGILVQGWWVNSQQLPPNLPPGTNPASWGDNGPIFVSGNTITCIPTWQSTFAINMGRSTSGLNHCTVMNNTVVGECTGGITKYPYGSDNLIVGNDLSRLTTHLPQIAVFANRTTVSDNVFGTPVDAAALLIMSVNLHPAPNPLDSPMPLPLEGCTILDNDYRNTGLPGWSEGWGSIMVASEAELNWWTGVGTEVRNNLIAESGRFPGGTGGAKKQIFQLIVDPNPLVHDNRIVGLPANITSDPGIGQRIKDARHQMLEAMILLDGKE